MTDTQTATTRHDEALVRALQDGLPLVPRPFAEIASRLGSDEDSVIAAVRRFESVGAIKRFGVVVRHRELGYRANAMVVWDIDDAGVDDLGAAFGRAPFVTLCYRRPRHLPVWPYNLFTMIHGRDRIEVMRRVDELAASAAADVRGRDVLFSRRRFKQRGARYVPRSSPEVRAELSR